MTETIEKPTPLVRAIDLSSKIAARYPEIKDQMHQIQDVLIFLRNQAKAQDHQIRDYERRMENMEYDIAALKACHAVQNRMTKPCEVSA
jgi:hypothetical protein